jgi:gamma-glutamyl:cysteine ligase YbdK (ATP-grasp superfamily)
MGRDIQTIKISGDDRRKYRDKMRRSLDVFARMLRESRFDDNPSQVGLEIELNLVDSDGAPSMRNADVLDALADPAWSTELGQFNLEINLPPRQLHGDALADLEQEVRASLNTADAKARGIGSRLVMIGILPTLAEDDVHEGTMSANARYRVLNEQIFAARGEDLRISIDGAEQLLTHADSVAPEAACTSVQLHVQVSPEAFACYWNAAQAIAGVQVALAANSPFLFGRQLWQETRIPLFEQSTDTRPDELKYQGVRPRVWFGERWITSVFDLFEENIRYFPALLPICEDEDPVDVLDRGASPQLAEMSLHNGTIYRWNRPVYAVVDGRPHLRVENRVLPAGPSVMDVMANAAFYYGLVKILAESQRPIWTQMSFATAGENLHEAARHGLDAHLYWPGLGDVPASELVLRRLLPLAREGLDRWGVRSDHADRLLHVIEQRCLTGRNGAVWQVESVAGLARNGGADRREALRLMTQQYIEHMHTNDPVHAWTARSPV